MVLPRGTKSMAFGAWGWPLCIHGFRKRYLCIYLLRRILWFCLHQTLTARIRNYTQGAVEILRVD
jgi:hypothetical protein